MKKLGCFFYRTACALSIGLMASTFIVIPTVNAATEHPPKFAAESKKQPAATATQKKPVERMSTDRRRDKPRPQY